MRHTIRSHQKKQLFVVNSDISKEVRKINNQIVNVGVQR